MKTLPAARPLRRIVPNNGGIAATGSRADPFAVKEGSLSTVQTPAATGSLHR